MTGTIRKMPEEERLDWKEREEWETRPGRRLSRKC
jgi:hypothetical protein